MKIMPHLHYHRSLQEQQQDDDGKTTVCFVGFVMDTYCINRGILLDSGSAMSETLMYPQRHSVHCLVDVDRCVHSGYEMLLPDATTSTNTEGGLHCRALQLDDTGNDLMLQFARETGRQGYCETCTSTSNSAPSRGFRAAVYGTIQSQSNPPVLAVTHVDDASLGCNTTNATVYVPSVVNCESGSYLPFMAAHGALMVVSWGFLLPLGIVAAKCLRPKQQQYTNEGSSVPLWFQIHRIAQPIGLILALSGWLTALLGPFDVLGSGLRTDTSFAHAVMGTIVMALGLLQPVNAYFRPHKDQQETDTAHHNENNNNGQASSMTTSTSTTNNRRRIAWEWTHKSAGYVAAFVGIVNCFIGMLLSGKYKNNFLYALIASMSVLVVVLVAACCYNKRIMNQQQQQSDQSQQFSQQQAGEVEEENPIPNEKAPLAAS